MGLALLIFILKIARKDALARFWGRIFAINFVVGVVTGLPMEFQFGTNWARFSTYAGGVVGWTLAMEGMFAFFAESAFLGLFLFGEKRLSRRSHLLVTFMVLFGSWLSGYFIVVTNAFMQHPVGHAASADGSLHLEGVWTYLANPWALWQYAHTMTAAVVTAAFVVAAVGAYWLLAERERDREHGQSCVRLGVVTGLCASALLLFPTGDQHGKLVAKHQRPALAAMEGKFKSSSRAELAIIGQPDVDHRRLENQITVPGALSFLAYGSFGAVVYGLDDFPPEDWPSNIELLYYAYHIMVGLGTLFIALMLASALMLWRGWLFRSRRMLWLLLLAFPFPYIATTGGWITAEMGRQPWIVYGLMRTADGTSPTVSAGNVTFTTLGFLGLYFVLGLVFVYLTGKQILRGPAPEAS
jgi:cytochrome d ubiquinol oxidase subunit I